MSKTEQRMKKAIDRAVEKAGSQHKLAEAIGTNQNAVFRMVKAGKAHHEYVRKIEAATGVSRHDLRPDLYPRGEK